MTDDKITTRRPDQRFDALLKAMAEGEKPSASEPKPEPDARTFRHKRPKA